MSNSNIFLSGNILPRGEHFKPHHFSNSDNAHVILLEEAEGTVKRDVVERHVVEGSLVKSRKQLSMSAAAVRKRKSRSKDNIRRKENERRNKRYAEMRNQPDHERRLLARREKRKKKRDDRKKGQFNLMKVPPSANALSPFADPSECEGVYRQTVDTKITEVRTIRHEYIPANAINHSPIEPGQNLVSVVYNDGKPVLIQRATTLK